MIKANELRIGNWIADRGGKEWQIYSWESRDKVSAETPMLFRTIKGHPLTEYVQYLKPIPLTEERLEKFGFERRESKMYDGHLDVWYFYIHDGKIMFNTELVTDGEIIIQFRRFPIVVKYVHQLQNLYFALTGEELEFKE